MSRGAGPGIAKRSEPRSAPPGEPGVARAAVLPSTGVRPPPLVPAAGGLLGIVLLLIGYTATRLAQSSVIALLVKPDSSVTESLLSWDAGWFIEIASQGYPSGYSYDASGDLIGNGLAFFPLYPALIWAVSGLGMNLANAALTISWVAGAAASVAVYLLGTSLYSRRVGYLLAALCFAQPMSVVLSMAYSESVFLALVAGTLLAAHRRVWSLAGIFGLAAALTRPTGAALAVALAVAALLALRTEDRAGRWRAGAAAGAALAGVPAFLLWVGHRVGDLDAWFTIQSAGWGTAFDGGLTTARFIAQTLRASSAWVPISVVWLLVATVLAAVIAILRRPWPPLIVYGVLVLALTLGQGGYYHSKPRLLLPVLLVFLPAALALARASTRTAVLVLLGYTAFGLWYGGYLVTIWPYTI